MKTSTSTTSQTPRYEKHILPLIEVEDDGKNDKREEVAFKLCSDPANPGSMKYTFSMKILKPENTLREALNYGQDVTKVIHGLGMSHDGPGWLAIMQRTTTGSVQQTLNTCISELRVQEQDRLREEAVSVAINQDQAAQAAAGVRLPDVTNAWVDLGCRAIITQAAPSRALATVKHQLRRETRKPSTMMMKKSVTRIKVINNVEVLQLPPFKVGQQIASDELMDIMYHAVPKSWRNAMELQGFDYTVATSTSLIEFCERMENSDNMGNDPTTQRIPKKKGSASASNTTPKPDGGKGVCMLHGPGHTSEDCHMLKKTCS